MEMKICDECNSNPANIHLTQIINNEVTVQHLCEECAKNKGISVVIEDTEDTKPALPQAVTEPALKEKTELKTGEKLRCSQCGLLFDEFKEKGWLGCPSCYIAFQKEIDNLLVQVHGASVHKGKMYRAPDSSIEINDDLVFLRKELDNAIQSEKFELAAAIRDKINSVSSEEPISKNRS